MLAGGGYGRRGRSVQPKRKVGVIEEEGGCGRNRRWMCSEKKVCETDGARVWYNCSLMAKE